MAINASFVAIVTFSYEVAIRVTTGDPLSIHWSFCRFSSAAAEMLTETTENVAGFLAFAEVSM